MKNELVGVVLIGRNEGERLKRALLALDRESLTVVYVDSNSGDGSPELARSLAVEVVQLDSSLPFSAARARNAGLERLMLIQPHTQFVQFVDGDCELDPSWIDNAVKSLRSNPQVAAIGGRRRERFPGASIYNLIIDDEWDTPIGPAGACGGDAMIRVSALRKCGGFDPTVAAGEEPELCHRFRNAGYHILRVDSEMSLHDAEITSFSQWWRRHIRSGYGGRDVQQRRQVDLFDQELRSAKIWTIGWATTTLLLVLIGYAASGVVGISIALVLSAGIWLLQAFRIANGFCKRQFVVIAAAQAGIISMLIKWANLFGQLRHWIDSRSGKHARLIEYKRQPNLTEPTGASTS